MQSNNFIQISRPFMPPMEEYQQLIAELWQHAWITNNGKYVRELENKLAEFLGVRNVIYCTNGTTALQLALEALVGSGEVITTPFSYVATLGSILWQKCVPVFADIREEDLCMDPRKVEERITDNTRAIMATHIFGHPCAVEELTRISVKYGIHIIYDGAHAFGCRFKDRSLLSYGDISTCSFNATKIFHTIEGGCLVTNQDILAGKIMDMRYFGFHGDQIQRVGINAKQSEFHAAMGLVNFNHFDRIKDRYREQFKRYESGLSDAGLQFIAIPADLEYNFSYFPVVFPDEKHLLRVMDMLQSNGITGKRYFYPSLNTLPFITYQSCPVSEDLSRRILCLPMFYDLEAGVIDKICGLLRLFS